MSNPKNIYLIGPMGSGKTSVGKFLAKLKKTTFYDSDEEIERRAGVSVAWIFEKEKEAGFRKREEEAIAILTKLKGTIIATGGGSVLSEKNRNQLKSTGTVVYLRVSLNDQLERTRRRKGKRPLLNQPNPKEKLEALNQAREPIYRELADLIYDTDNKEPIAIAKQILKDV